MEITMKTGAATLKFGVVAVCLLVPLVAGSSALACATTPVGAVINDAEKDTVGRSCAPSDVEITSSLSARRVVYQLPARAFGAEIGDPEKDTLAYAPLADEESTDGTP
jgi:hypothetical protein